MAVRQVEKAPSGRAVLLTSLLGLAVVSAASFGRVFQGRWPTFQLALAAGVAIVLAAALERQGILLATLASLVALVLATSLLVFPHTLHWWLPTMRTWHAAVRAFAAVTRTANSEVAPAAPLRPLVLASLVAVWTAAYASHALAARARSPFLALLPPAALIAFAGKMVSGGARPLYVVAFLLAAMALLLSDGLRRVRQWGPVTAWQGRRSAGRPGATMKGARWVAVVTLGVAVLIPGILPGYHHPGLVDVHNGPGGIHVSIDPIVDIQQDLQLSQPVPLFTVRSAEGAYWRFLTLDEFTGTRWTASNPDATGGQVVQDGTIGSSPPIQPEPGAIRTVTESFTYDKLIQQQLPMAPVALRVTSSTPLRFDPALGTLVSPERPDEGFSYTVTSELVQPSPKDLDAFSMAQVQATPALKQYTELPGGMPDQIAKIAHQLTDGEPTPYQKVVAIQQYLKLHYRYDQNVRLGHSTNAILDFLTKTKAGFCEQFAGTMAVLLRSLGIPARVAVGFTPGTPSDGGKLWQVTTSQAHAWVEVLFPTYGWLAFEPTPSRFNPTAARYVFGVPSQTGPSGEDCNLFRIPGAGGGRPSDPCAGGKGGRKGTDVGAGPTLAPEPAAKLRPAGTSWRTIAAASFGGLLLLVLLAVPVVKVIRRRLSRRRARRPTERVLVAFTVMADRAADVGLGRRPAETLAEYRARLQHRIPTLNGDLEALTRLTTLAAYADDPLSEDDAERAEQAAKTTSKEIRGNVGLARRAFGWFRLDRARLPKVNART